MLFPDGIDFIAAFFGCIYAGVIAVPTYTPRPNRPLDTTEAIVKNAGAELVLSTARLAVMLEQPFSERQVLNNLCWLSVDELNETSCQDPIKSVIRAEDTAFLQYTSGSTGCPKGVIVSHANLISNQRMIQQAFSHNEQTSVVGWLPLFHDMGLIGNTLQPLYLGVTAYLMPPMVFLQRPLCWLRCISDFGGTTSGAPNFAYDYCVDKIRSEQMWGLDLSCWKVAFNGSEPVKARTMDRFVDRFSVCGFKREAFYPCYGLAEATLFVTGGNCEEAPTITNVKRQALDGNSRLQPVDRSSDPIHSKTDGCASRWRKVCIASDLDAMEAFSP